MDESNKFTAKNSGSILYSHKQTDFVTPHMHDYHEIVYYIEGKGLTTIYDETVYNFKFREDCIIVIPPHISHDEYAATRTRIICNQLSLTGETFNVVQFYKKTAGTCELFEKIKAKMLSINALYKRLKKGADKELEQKTLDEVDGLEIYMYRLAALSARRGEKYYAEIVAAAKAYIRKHFCEKINFDILAEQFGYSYDRLRHIFQEHTGMTLYAYQQGLQLDYAKKLLATTVLKISEVARETGFGGSVRFCEWFGRLAGISPLKYREMNKIFKWGVVLNIKDIQDNRRMVNLILDTDLGCDCDDAAAIAIANIFHREKTVNVLCITQSLNDSDAARAVDWINAHYGNDFDVGVSDSSRVDATPYLARYVHKLRDEFHTKKRFAPSAELIKEKLRQAEDGSVTMAFIGQLNNLAQILRDAEGKELVHRKVEKIVIMGGNFEDYGEHYFFHGQRFDAEFNIALDVESAQSVVKHTELPLEFIDFNQGLKVLSGGVIKDAVKNPVARIYKMFGVVDRESWDLITVLYAMLGDGKMFGRSAYGRVTLDEKGRTRFTEGGGRHRILDLIKSQDVAKQVDEILLRT